MSKFRKVSEIENIPSFIEKKFVGASYEAFDDPYAELKNNSTENRIKISKQSIGNQNDCVQRYSRRPFKGVLARCYNQASRSFRNGRCCIH